LPPRYPAGHRNCHQTPITRVREAAIDWLPQHVVAFGTMQGGDWSTTAGAAWARFYDRVGSAFAIVAAPKIRAWYETTPVGQQNRSLLDVCCGTGQLARHFLDHGYTVTALDVSAEMLRYAGEHAGDAVEAGRASFVRADAADFEIQGTFGSRAEAGGRTTPGPVGVKNVLHEIDPDAADEHPDERPHETRSRVERVGPGDLRLLAAVPEDELGHRVVNRQTGIAREAPDYVAERPRRVLEDVRRRNAHRTAALQIRLKQRARKPDRLDREEIERHDPLGLRSRNSRQLGPSRRGAGPSRFLPAAAPGLQSSRP
jgi:SAM-dependent methyltransferase